ncbi:MAG: 23S rRNA (pseudouridine(1915)-N(3))-methyltransferase RlmH [Oscillospiraceae bacterium]|nr:23S rRNA (pseudouridine(1915)-N(3))-methyltransferase RlmH [Oscillospiraceae bacterium]
MLHIRLVCVGKLKERFLQDAMAEYAKRLGAFCSFEVKELPEERLGEAPAPAEIAAALRKEAVQIEKQLLKTGTVVCLCIEGREMDSEAFSQVLTKAELSGQPEMTFLIGGSFGLDEELKKKADLRLSMSRMTFPHHLARVMLAEQLYRGFQIKAGTRYHK